MQPTIKTVIFIGKQGSGKGTQGQLLEATLAKNGSVFHYQTGHAFRELAEGPGYTNKLVAASLPGGHIQPLFLATWLWADAFVKNLTGEEHIIADGFPRRVPEAEVLDAAFAFYGRTLVDVINLEIDNDIATARLLERGRSDDTEAGIRERLDWFDREAKPVLDFFHARKRYAVHDIDSTRPVDEIAADIRAALGLS